MVKPSKISMKEYYYELLKNRYVNIFINKNTEMIKKYDKEYLQNIKGVP